MIVVVINYLKIGISFVLCAISTILTACFALSFGSFNTESPDLITVITPYLLIAIGVLIDISKYIFWGVKDSETHKAYMALSLILMAFSWLASVAFFISSEDAKLSVYRKQSAEYATYQLTLSNIDYLINQKEKIFKTRLQSAHHKQWDKSETINIEIQALREDQLVLILDEANIGMNAAKKALVSAAFFQAIASVLGIEATTIRNLFYTVLALLIEACALGLISLNKIETEPAIKKNKTALPIEKPKIATRVIRDKNTSQIKPTPQVTRQTKIKPSYTDDIERMIQDIKSGTVAPTFNQLKVQGYSISQGKIKEILTQLKDKGILKLGYRNSLELVTTPLTVVTKNDKR